MEDPARRAAAEQLIRQLGVTPDNVDDVCFELMKRFI
jgi:hypothetical protein